MSRAAVNEKKLAVLQVVKEKRNVLFSSCHNNPVRKQEKEKAWKEVLRKAQSLGLASADRGWIYARDHIFGLWKSRTLAKGDNVIKTPIDVAILDILGGGAPLMEGLELSEVYRVEFKTESPDLDEQQDYPLDGDESANTELHEPRSYPLVNVEIKQEEQELHVQRDIPHPNPTIHSVRGGAKRKWDNSDSINFLKKQVLKSELYKNKLLILQLERKLGLPPSKFTYDLQNQC